MGLISQVSVVFQGVRSIYDFLPMVIKLLVLGVVGVFALIGLANFFK